MKITKELLKQIIKEEIQRTLTEQEGSVERLEEKKFDPSGIEMAAAQKRAVQFGKILQKDLTEKGTLRKALKIARDQGRSDQTISLIKQYFTQVIQAASGQDVITNNDLIYQMDKLLHDKYSKFKDTPGTLTNLFVGLGYPVDMKLTK